MTLIGHNNPPRDRSFKKRWAYRLFNEPRKPYGSIAMAFKIYMEMDSQGFGATISDEEFRASCGVSDGSCRLFKKWLVDNEFIRILLRGQRGRKSEFQAVIPGEIAAHPAAIQEEIPAPNTGNSEEYRRPIPVFETRLPATVAAICDQAAPVAAIGTALSRARLESSLREDSYTLQVVSEEKEENPLTPLDALAAFEAYNEMAQRVGLPLARTLTPQRRKHLIARLREHGGLTAWHIALANVERSAFLQGANDRAWRADFDFLLQASKLPKVIEGTYGNGAHAQPKEGEFDKIGRLVRQANQNQQGKFIE